MAVTWSESTNAMIATAAPPDATGRTMTTGLYTVTYLPDGKFDLTFHFHPGQARAWQSTARFTWVIAGTQSGKTSWGPLWLWREMQRRGPGDYLAVTATVPLRDMKMLPEFLRFFVDVLHLGTWHEQDKYFELDGQRAAALFEEPAWRHAPSRVIFGSAVAPQSLESATAKAAWLDEVGQRDFKLEAWEAVQRRLAIHQGRVFGGTTPYDLGWLKTHVYDRWKAGDPDHYVVTFASVDNPAFPQAEAERARRNLPYWKYAMFYLGQYTTVGSLIYADFNEEYREYGGHKVHAFPIPQEWPCWIGVDFGAVNLAVVWLTKDPGTNVYYVYRELHGGTLQSKSAAEHVRLIKRHSGSERIRGWHGGAKSEKQFRLDWAAAGAKMPEPTVWEVEVGIDKVTELLRANRLYVFDTCRGVLDEFATYGREVDTNGEPTETIKDKAAYHRLDAARYVVIGATQTQPRAALGQGVIRRAWGR